VHGGAATAHDDFAVFFERGLDEYKSVTGAVYKPPRYEFWADLGVRYGRMDAVGQFLHGKRNASLGG